MDEYGPEAAETLGAWAQQARNMYSWPLDPDFDWSRYSCRKCGQFLGAQVRTEGWRYPVVRPVPWYEVSRHEYGGRSLLELAAQAHLAGHVPRWRPKRGHPTYSNSRAPIRIIIYSNGRTGFGATVGTEREIEKGMPPDTEILADRRFESDRDAGDFFHWFTFFKPHRARLLARERKRKQRARERLVPPGLAEPMPDSRPARVADLR